VFTTNLYSEQRRNNPGWIIPHSIILIEPPFLARNYRYTSDQGFYLGDHGWFDKRFMYEVSLSMPLMVRFHGLIESGSVNDDLVTNLEFAPALLELVGIDKPQDMQGRSFVKLLENREVKNWRDSLYSTNKKRTQYLFPLFFLFSKLACQAPEQKNQTQWPNS